eukprot:gene50624-61922_t
MLTRSYGQGDVEVEQLCALINDNQRMQEKCDEFGKDLLHIITQEDERDIIEAVLDEVSREYLNIARRAVETLSKSIMLVLDEPVFLRVYSQDWENDENPLSTLVITLQDYFSDLQDWLSEYHFSKLLREMLHRVVVQYVMSLRRKVSESVGRENIFTFTNELLAAKKIIQDRVLLQDHFEKFIPLLRMAGVKTKEMLADELEPLQYLTKLITCRTFATVEADCRALYTKYGIDGLRACQAALLCNPSLPKQDRQANFDAAKKLFDTGVQHGVYSQTPLEDFVNFDSQLVSFHKEKEVA